MDELPPTDISNNLTKEKPPDPVPEQVLSQGDQISHSSLKSGVVEFIQTIVVSAAIGMVIYLFIAQPHKVQGLSMYPNFHSGDYIISNKIGYRFSPPQRGQVVILQNPRNNSQDYIKRIIGLPGEKVMVQDGHVYINGQILKEPYLDPSLTTPSGSFMPDGQEITTPEDSYIVMGDNRPASSDSREWGFVKRDELIGAAFFRYWSDDTKKIGLIPSVKY